MAAFLDNVRFNPTLGSTTDWTYSSAVTGYQSPALAGVVNGTVYEYFAISADSTQWEMGRGAYNTGTGVLARTTVLYNSSGTGTATGQSGAGTKISFSAAPQVAVVAIKESLISIEEANSFTAAQKAQAQANIAISIFPQGRLTLTAGVAVTTSDVTGAISVFYTSSGGQVPIYNGTAMAPTAIAGDLTLALDSTAAHTGYQQSGFNFDCFIINDAGTIRLGTGPSWAAGAVAGSDTARGTGAGSTELQLINGIWTNKNTITIRWGNASGNTVSVAANQATYVGTLRTTADGVTEDSAVKRFLYNAYNQATRPMSRVDTTASWTYSTASYRQANGSASNQIAYVAGLTGSQLTARVTTICLNSTSTPRIVYAGIGLDSATVNSRTTSNFCRLGDATLSSPGGPTADYAGSAQLGYHFVAWLEKGFGTDTQTWFGLLGSDYQTGIIGSVMA